MNKLILGLTILCLASLPVIGLAQGGACIPTQAGGTTGASLCNPLGKVSTIDEVFTLIFTFIGSVIILASIVMIVYSGFRMVTANGDPETIKSAKSGLTWSLIGFAVSIMSFVIVVAVQNFIGANPANVQLGQGLLKNPLAAKDLQTFVLDMLNYFLSFVGILTVMMIVVNGFRYMTSAGNEEQITTAKSGLLWSLLGFVAIVVSYVIVVAVRSLLP